ncbi:MAG: fibronectin type III domain-containing protein [Candidatus Hodarchaeaceae archaeon]|nr:fibronectin type III domain-containing protein [Candidatus Hodarchaeaceae archaeon]
MKSKYCIAIMSSVLFLAFAQTCTAQVSDEVKFRGTVIRDENYGDLVCYGSYHVGVQVYEILEDDNSLLALDNIYTVAYSSTLAVENGDNVEVYGMAWFGPDSPKQCYGYIEAKSKPEWTPPKYFYIQILPEYAHHVKTLPVADVTESSARLRGYLTMGLAETAYVWFEYQEENGEIQETPHEMKFGGGEFSCSLENLHPNTIYRFRACESTDNGVWREFVTLETEGKEAVPIRGIYLILIVGVVSIAIVIGLVFMLKKR